MVQFAVGAGNRYAKRISKLEYIKDILGVIKLELSDLTWQELANNHLMIKAMNKEKASIIKARRK